MIDDLTHDLANEASIAVSQKIANKGSIRAISTADIIKVVAISLDKKIESGKRLVKSVGAVGALSMGRTAIYQKYPERIYAFQYSAILDSRTTDYCRALDGKVVDV